jgi:hypothetical protein
MTSGVRPSGWRRSSSEPLEVREPDLDERTDLLLESRLARDRQRLLVALADLLRGDALLQAVVAGQEQLVDPLPCPFCHAKTLVGKTIFRIDF